VDESVDFAAGILLKKKAGMMVQEADILAEVYTDRESVLSNAVRRVQGAFSFAEQLAEVSPLIAYFVTKDGVQKFDDAMVA